MQLAVVCAQIVSAWRAPPRRHGPALYSSRAYHGLGSSTSPSSPSGSRKNTLCAEPKSLIVPSLAPSFISRVRMVSKAFLTPSSLGPAALQTLRFALSPS